ncbi:MAG TPA: DUF760 domain-containing protein [Stenomitos sp.]
MNPVANFGKPNLEQSNQLWQYVSSMEPEAAARLAQPTSEEVLQVMERHVASLLGHLPGQQFDVMISTNRENLGRLLAAAMMNGYFLRAAEQRMAFEQALGDIPISESDAPATEG